MKIKKAYLRHKNAILTFAFDILFCIVSFNLASLIMFNKIPMPGDYSSYEIITMAVTCIITLSMLVFFDCYNTVWKYAGRVDFFKFIIAYFCSFILIYLFKVFMNIAVNIQVWVPLIIIFLLFSAIAGGCVRFINGIIHYIIHLKHWTHINATTNAKNTIIIGAGYTGALTINRFINNPHEGYFPIALIDDDKNKKNLKIYGIKVFGGLEEIEDVVKKFKVDAFVIAIMGLNKSQLKRIYAVCSKYNLPIKLMPAIADANEFSHRSLDLRDIKIEELLGREEFQVRQELIDSSVKDKVVCVTGGAGSIGSELCRQALNFGCKHLVIFDMHENGMFDLNQEFSRKFDTSRYSLVMGSVRERLRLRETFERYKPDIVFHAAAYKHVPMMEISSTEAIKNNVFGTRNVIEQAIESDVKKFVMISTDKAVNPANIMGASKRIAEMLVQSYSKKCKMQMAAVRFGNVLGSNGSVIPIFLKQIKEGGPITLTHKDIKRYFMTIPEAVRLVLQTAALASSGEIFVLDMGEPVLIYDLACDVIRINGFVPEEDIPIVVSGLRPGEKLFEELRFDNESTDKTLHEGIFVTKMQELDHETFDKQLEQLKITAHDEDIEATTELIFEIVPSVYREDCKCAQCTREQIELNCRTQSQL